MGNPYESTYPVKSVKEEPVEAIEEVEEVIEEDTTPETLEETAEELPEDLNTIKEVLGWVQEDKSRAELVLAQERASETPRVTLVKGLEAIING